MNKHTIELPIRIDCDDYHELSYLETFFKKLNKNIHVHEVGFDGTICKYIGIAYIGFLSDDQCDELLDDVIFDGAEVAKLYSFMDKEHLNALLNKQKLQER